MLRDLEKEAGSPLHSPVILSLTHSSSRIRPLAHAPSFVTSSLRLVAISSHRTSQASSPSPSQPHPPSYHSSITRNIPSQSFQCLSNRSSRLSQPNSTPNPSPPSSSSCSSLKTQIGDSLGTTARSAHDHLIARIRCQGTCRSMTNVGRSPRREEKPVCLAPNPRLVATASGQHAPRARNETFLASMNFVGQSADRTTRLQRPMPIRRTLPSTMP